jgi:hypothetical protein
MVPMSAEDELVGAGPNAGQGKIKIKETRQHNETPLPRRGRPHPLGQARRIITRR